MVAFESAAQTEQVEEGAPLPEGILYGSDPLTGGGASNARSFFLQSGTGYAIHFAASPSLAVRSDGTPLVAFA